MDFVRRPNWPFRATFHSFLAIPRSDLTPWNWPEVRKGRNADPYRSTGDARLSEARLAAIVDFTLNLGAGRLQKSTLMRRINQRDWHGAGKELRRWVYGGGKILPGLVTRREAELALLSG